MFDTVRLVSWVMNLSQYILYSSNTQLDIEPTALYSKVQLHGWVLNHSSVFDTVRLVSWVMNSSQNIRYSSKHKKNNVYPCKPQFYYIKVGFKGVNIISVRFVMSRCKTEAYRGIHYFSYVCSKTQIVGTR